MDYFRFILGLNFSWAVPVKCLNFASIYIYQLAQIPRTRPIALKLQLTGYPNFLTLSIESYPDPPLSSYNNILKLNYTKQATCVRLKYINFERTFLIKNMYGLKKKEIYGSNLEISIFVY